MNALDIKVLPFSSKARICWGFFWRSIVIAIGSALSGALLGAIAGFALAFLGVTKGIAVVGGILGAVCGAFFLYLLVRWLLTSRIGNFRLVLVNAQGKI
jgi:hypothetical protein